MLKEKSGISREKIHLEGNIKKMGIIVKISKFSVEEEIRTKDVDFPTGVLMTTY